MSSTDATDTFIRKLSSLERAKTAGEKFRDFCEMSYCSLARLTAGPDKGEELEARYMQIVETYPDKDTVRAYPELLSLVMRGICGGQDVLGRAAGELGALDGQLGQFVTPYELCRLMAKLTLTDAPSVIDREDFITVLEPCVGAGAMLIATADEIHSQGFDPALQMLAHAMDISRLCYHMAFVQLSLKGIPAYVEHANTLTMERFDGAWTPGAVLFHRHHGRLFPEDHQPATGTPEPEEPVTAIDPEQLSLL